MLNLGGRNVVWIESICLRLRLHSIGFIHLRICITSSYREPGEEILQVRESIRIGGRCLKGDAQ